MTAYHRHSREGGNPYRADMLDSRLRGNDGVMGEAR
jgi:hypothetical protein